MQVPNSEKTTELSEASEVPEESESSNSSLVAGGYSSNAEDEPVIDVSGKTLDFSPMENSDGAVKGLYIYKNVFNLIPKSVGSLGRLRTLKFFGNEISLFPSEFRNLMGLECLQVKISSPRFGGLQLNKLKDLKELELSKVPPRPSAFPIMGDIAGLKSLTKLTVCHFSIRHVFSVWLTDLISSFFYIFFWGFWYLIT